MTGEEMERAIGFLLEHDSRFNEAIDRVKEAIDRLTGMQATTSSEIQDLKVAQAKTTDYLQLPIGKTLDLTDSVARLEAQAEADRQEMRGAIDNLIVAIATG